MEPESGKCICGGTGDCSPSVSYCVPAELEPPPVERCRPAGVEVGEAPVISDPAFTVEPVFTAEDVGLSNCEILTVSDDGRSAELECTGSATGTYALYVATPVVALVEGELVQLQYFRRDELEAVDEWLRLTRDVAAPEVAILAVQARQPLMHSEYPEDLWPASIEIGVGDIGCPEELCPPGDDTTKGQAIAATNGDETAEYAPGETGPVPGVFEGSSPVVNVVEARDLCSGEEGSEFGERYAFVIAQALE